MWRLLLFTHLFGCVWFFIGINNEYKNGWLQNYEYEYSDKPTQYIVSLYFAIISVLTIGYGDMSPQTNIERIFLIVASLMSTIMVGYNINAIG